MTEKTRLQLLAWAREYHCAAFIQGDPVQFPHRYMQKQDIEVSGLLTAIMSFGNRKTDIEESGRTAWFNGNFTLPVCLVLQMERRFPAYR